MGSVIGDLLPLALGVAISPVPIIAVILMLLAPRATAASVGFAIGWVVGIVVVTTVTVAVASSADIAGDGDSGPSTGASWVQLVLGLLLLALAVKQWRGRPRPGDEAHLPTWMAAIDTFNAGKALGLGFLLSAVNPKNLLMCMGAGVLVADSALDGGEQTATIAVFTLLAASTVLIPVVAYLVARERMRHPLDELKVWLQANNATVMSVLLLVIGVVLLGKGIGGLVRAGGRSAEDETPALRTVHTARMLIRFLVRLALLACAIGLTAWLLPDVEIEGGLLTYLWIALLFALVNAILGPILHLLALPITVVTLGLFALVVNAALVGLTALLSPDFQIDGFFTAIVAALLISVFSWLLNLLVRA